MSRHWMGLLKAETQPASLRACYELLETLRADLERPTDINASTLRADEAARLGYLVSAFQLMGGVEIHPSWALLRDGLQARLQPSAPLALFSADPGVSTSDGLANMWGLARGVDSLKLAHIATHGIS